MPHSALRRFLQSTGLITAAQAEEIAAGFAPKTLRKNEFLLQAGRVSDEYLFLDHGFLRAFAYDPVGHEVTTGFYAAGQVVLEVASFFTRSPAQESIQALADCAGWCISYEQLNALFHSRSEFREFGRTVLVRGYAALKTRMLATITESAAVRYAHLLQASPEVFRHAPLHMVASYLGITATSLSRLRREAAGK